MKTVLIVEDFPLNRDLLVQLLEDRYHVVVAEDGITALERAAETRPDLVLMDLHLPKVDGWEVTRRLKADPRLAHVPVFALSARAMRGDEERAREAGCDEFISKPLDHALLYDKLARYLGR